MTWGEGTAIYAALLSTFKAVLDWWRAHREKSRLLITADVRHHRVFTGVTDKPAVELMNVVVQLLNIGKDNLKIRRLIWKESPSSSNANFDRELLWETPLLVEAGELKNINIDHPEKLSPDVIGIEVEDSTGRVWKMDKKNLSKLKSDLPDVLSRMNPSAGGHTPDAI